MSSPAASDGPLRAQLIAMRKRWNMSVPELAEIIGGATRTLYAWEAGEAEPKAANLTNWANALGCDVVLRFRQ